MLDYLLNKKIAILGLGANNKSLVAYFERHGITFTIFDKWNDPSELLGQLDEFEYIFRTPGVPFLSPLIQDSLAKGIVVYSQTKLFFDICPCPIIGVTGTKGKGTTSSLVHSIIERSGKKSWLAGNIGKDPFEFIDEIKPSDVVVLELSSFQLQDLEKSPHIAVVLSITSDHVNPALKMATHYSLEEYVKAKSTIVKFQTTSDFAVLHPDLPVWFRKLGEAKKEVIDPKSVTGLQTKLLGKHNLENISAAVKVAEILGIQKPVIEGALQDFKPLPHRLTPVLTKNDVTYVDDSLSTTVDSSIAAIDAFDSRIVLILGGSDKGHDYTDLTNKIKSDDKVKAVVVVGDVASRIVEGLNGYRGTIFTGANTMKEILEQANSVTQKGDVVLLSPAAASFGMFKDYKDRADQFLAEASK